MKNIKRIIFIGCLFFAFVNQNFAQVVDHVLGEMIIQKKNNDIAFRSLNSSWTYKKRLFKDLNIWLIEFDFTKVDENRLMYELKSSNDILAVQFNYLIKSRSTTPNDPNFPLQWQYMNNGSNDGVVGADLDAELAWDITTGGLTPHGDTIVVCVVDDGIQIDHEDFGNNLWVNHEEIPNNGIDDDNNGYIDDYRGWNFAKLTPDDNFTEDSHGTSVAAIIGAKGNNNIGVTGVNWDVKLMIIERASDVASAFQSFDYPFQMRKKYNNTKGSKGAFVVTINGSWGVDAAMAKDNPIWCNIYDILGEEGIISCAATSNNGNLDVDVYGDMPTTCESDFLISVTNIDRANIKAEDACYGQNSIDLGAYGDLPGSKGVVTLGSNSNMDKGFGGTSAAAPHVAGTVALLYSADCSNLSYYALRDPAGTALKVKSFILDGVKSNSSLVGKSVTGGVLNMKNSLDITLASCESCPNVVVIESSQIIDTTAIIHWEQPENTSKVVLEWKEKTSSNWIVVNDISSPYKLTGLSACIDYEFRIKAECDDVSAGFSEIHALRTVGCCENPELIISDANIKNTSAIIQWLEVFGAEEYRVEYKKKYGGDWIVNSITWPTVLAMNGLEKCTDYVCRIQTICDGETLDYSKEFAFSTTGCTTCDQNYCFSRGNIKGENLEWIDEVTIGDISFNTGIDISGYGDHTGNTFVFEPGKTYPLTIIPKFDAIAYYEYSRVWIDFNNDGVFEDGSEMVFDQMDASKTTAIGEVEIPNNTQLGGTRMRVSMIFGGNGLKPSNCGQYDYGEVEDYCVKIADLSKKVLDLDTIWVGASMVRLNWSRIIESDGYSIEYKKSSESQWNSIYANINILQVPDLDWCTHYDFRVKPKYGDVYGPVSSTITVKTDCDVATNDISKPFDLKISPNPFNESFTFELSTKEKYISVRIFNTIGNLIQKKQFSSKNGKYQLKDLDNLSSGLYIVEIQSGNERWIGKVVKN